MSIHKVVFFDAPPHDVFEALMDERKHSAFTGEEAKINRRVGGKFSTWGGWAKGTTLKLEKDKTIFQSWRSEDFPPEARDSIVGFHLSKSGDRTRMMFSQSWVPKGLATDLEDGWQEYYWEPLKKFLAKKK